MADTEPKKASLTQAEPAKGDVAPGEVAAGKKRKTRRAKRTVPTARACVYAGDNNTIVSITDLDGNVLGWASSGSSGFKGSRKSTPYAAKIAAEKAMTSVASFGIQSMHIEVKGIGPGREQAIRGLQLAGINFESIIDKTPIAHGGCRRPKPRRV